jgi:glycerate-2-kinase
MSPVGEQMALPGSRTNPDLIAARFLLKPGRKYEQAVKAFEPYDSIKEEKPEARAAGRALIAEGKAAGPKSKTFLYVNNRLEGNVISTIAAVLESR